MPASKASLPSRGRAIGPYVVTGSTYARLTALEDAVRSRDMIMWRCICGGEKRIRAEQVKRGNSRSCGCLFLEVAAATIRAHNERRGERPAAQGTKSKHPLYVTWKGMIDRTTRPSHDRYPRYGGRGIRVCAQWHDAEAFYADTERTIGPRPGRGWSLDRIDNDGDYEPGNVRWATPAMQTRNRARTWTSATGPSVVNCSFRAPAALYGRLTAGAERDGRTLGDQVIWLLERALADGDTPGTKHKGER